MYYETPAHDNGVQGGISAWCALPMWLALLPLLGLGLWWPDAIWSYFGTIAHALGYGPLVGGSPP